MSAETTFIQLKSIQVNPPKARRHDAAHIGIYTTQRIVLQFADGSQHDLTLFLETGMHALALGELITNAEVTA